MPAGALGLIGIIIVVNGYHYFGAYTWGLPNYNQPWGWEIAKYIDSLPAKTVVKLTDCCWGEWGQPEPKGIYYVLQNQAGRHNIVTDYPFVSRCEELAGRNNYVLIFRPDNSRLIDRFRGCYPEAPVQLHRDALGQTVFYSMELAGK
jgi:hypothetical protein